MTAKRHFVKAVAAAAPRQQWRISSQNSFWPKWPVITWNFLPWLTSAADDEYLRARLEALLRQLAPEFAEVVVLHIWGEHTFQQIADMTGNKLSTITSRYRYALQSLRRELEANPIER